MKKNKENEKGKKEKKQENTGYLSFLFPKPIGQGATYVEAPINNDGNLIKNIGAIGKIGVGKLETVIVQQFNAIIIFNSTLIFHGATFI